MKIKSLIIPLILLSVVACNQSPKQDASTEQQNGNGVYFVNLKEGDTVKTPVIVQMGVRGMEVEPAGAYKEGKGHNHLIIDGNYVEKGEMVPEDETHLHFGKGQISDTLNLSPGQHELTLQFADGLHRSYGKDWSKAIRITVAPVK